MHAVKHAILFLLFISFASAGGSAGAPVVDLGYVKYAGGHNATTGINYYRGIRFAQNPTGDLRWREPVPIEQNASYIDQTIDATQEGPGCYQGTPFWSGPPSPAPLGVSVQSEDCLLLDVLVPVNPRSAHLPVMVQIHGGGYTEGSASTVAPGDALVNASNGGLIYVQIQYRLGMWGFLGGNEIAENGVRNAGLYDQRAALDWVQRHISAFGGDPAKVTIIGNISMSFTDFRGECGWWECDISIDGRRRVRPATVPRCNRRVSMVATIFQRVIAGNAVVQRPEPRKLQQYQLPSKSSSRPIAIHTSTIVRHGLWSSRCSIRCLLLRPCR